jgi:hypothetical protein
MVAVVGELGEGAVRVFLRATPRECLKIVPHIFKRT